MIFLDESIEINIYEKNNYYSGLYNILIHLITNSSQSHTKLIIWLLKNYNFNRHGIFFLTIINIYYSIMHVLII